MDYCFITLLVCLSTECLWNFYSMIELAKNKRKYIFWYLVWIRTIPPTGCEYVAIWNEIISQPALVEWNSLKLVVVFFVSSKGLCHVLMFFYSYHSPALLTWTFITTICWQTFRLNYLNFFCCRYFISMNTVCCSVEAQCRS